MEEKYTIGHHRVHGDPQRRKWSIGRNFRNVPEPSYQGQVRLLGGDVLL